jgi:hypothetical protein
MMRVTYIDGILPGFNTLLERREHPNAARTFQDAGQRRVELHHQAQCCRPSSGVQRSTGQRAGSPYTQHFAVPAPRATSMDSGSETLADAYPAVACNNMPTTITPNDADVRGSQSSSQGNACGSQASSLNLPEQQRAREHVKDHVAARGTDVERFSKDAKKEAEVFSVSQVDDVVNEGDSADWCQHSPSRSNACRNHDEASSEALSSAGSGVSQSLGGREKDRDIAVAEFKFEEAKLRPLQMDARVGLSRRSRTSSQASSVRSDE